LASRRALSVALLVLAIPAAAQTAFPAAGPPFDVTAPTPHHIAAVFDTEPARDILTLLAGGNEAPAALRRLKGSVTARVALKAEETNAEDFFGRLVTAAAGTPDPLLAGYAARAPLLLSVLDTVDGEGPGTTSILAARIASLLPPDPAVTARLVVVPFLGTGGFREVTTAGEEATLYVVVDLPRLLRDAGGRPQPREALFRMLREAGSEAWRMLFSAHFRKAPAWPDGSAADFDALLARTVAEGPPALFLIPDEFFPFDPFFAEPVTRAFKRWNETAEALLKPETKEAERRDLLRDAGRGDFWAQYPAIVGAQFADVLLRKKGRSAYLAALAAGPRAVARLYVETVKGTDRPDVSKQVRKLLEAAPKP
jgi:hypothetical protein